MIAYVSVICFENYILDFIRGFKFTWINGKLKPHQFTALSLIVRFLIDGFVLYIAVVHNQPTLPLNVPGFRRQSSPPSRNLTPSQSSTRSQSRSSARSISQSITPNSSPSLRRSTNRSTRSCSVFSAQSNISSNADEFN